MSRTTSTAGVGRPASHYGDVAPDKGCSVWPECVSCPWRECIAELTAQEMMRFRQALRLVRSYMAKPDGAITG